MARNRRAPFLGLKAQDRRSPHPGDPERNPRESICMRSSKSRSRNKNRNRPQGGNVINRVFDSSGPEGKVRGTPQQVIDKYNQLARDAQLSGDRVATENFQQHAEHYTRLLAQAQKEMDARRDHQGGQQGQGGHQNVGQQNNGQHGGQGGQQNGGQQNGGGSQGNQQDGQGGGQHAGQQGSQDGEGGGRSRRRRDRDDRPTEAGAEVIETGGDAGLVETPEARADAPADTRAEGPKAAAKPEIAEDEAPKPRRRTRRKAPKADGEAGDAAPTAEEA